MAVTAAQFKARFPEFTNADDTLVDEVLAEAVLLCPDTIWGDHTDQGVKYTTAQRLAQMPTAREMALNPDGSTVYDKPLAELKSIVAAEGMDARLIR